MRWLQTQCWSSLELPQHPRALCKGSLSTSPVQGPSQAVTVHRHLSIAVTLRSAGFPHAATLNTPELQKLVAYLEQNNPARPWDDGVMRRGFIQPCASGAGSGQHTEVNPAHKWAHGECGSSLCPALASWHSHSPLAPQSFPSKNELLFPWRVHCHHSQSTHCKIHQRGKK